MKFSPWRILLGACAAVSFVAASAAGAAIAESASTPPSSAQVSTFDDLCRLVGKAAGEEAAGEGFDLATQRHKAESAYWHCVGHDLAPVAVQDDRDDGPWSATLYLGPSSTKYAVATFMSLNMHPTGVMAGLAVDRKLFYLGYDISLAAEGQVTQYFFGHENTTFAFGLGLQCNKLFGFENTSMSVYDGPSFALDPPYTSIGYKGHVWPALRKKFLNFVSMEVAVRLSEQSKWDAVFRFYHRSGMFGVYSDGDDDGVMFGLGIRRRF